MEECDNFQTVLNGYNIKISEDKPSVMRKTVRPLTYKYLVGYVSECVYVRSER
jgi:hypothetical protein